MRTIPTIIGAAALLTLTLSTVGHAQEASVEAVDIAFEPATITIEAGDTVTWTNSGDLPHTVTADDGAFDSGQMASGDTFQQSFDSEGTFEYFCEIHSTADGSAMNGTVVVEAAAATEAPTETGTPTPEQTPTTEEAPAVADDGGESAADEELAETGEPAWPLVLSALAIVALGVTALLATRRRT